ncbi:hypothetical protein PILCRDRAFT_17521 [Piloderma croceum F 1598]|uniref:Uncharacterized protein n=1 Tax=Piloderma croceum (strain F 1598) TaxID=765440 RepID=A0A0C3B160_PILCF|nr:hypothetical protein PILCRDRAFT_17521 [Piloderma croceum F 1598]
MKVYLPALEGYIPPKMMKTLRAFLEFCYIARRDVIDTQSLTELEQALDRFHQYRTIFMETGVRRLDKLAASRVDFARRGMLVGTCLSYALYVFAETNEVASNNPVDHIGNDVERNIDDDNNDGGDVPGPTVLATVELAKTLIRRDTAENLAASLDEPDLMRLIQSFLQDQLRDTLSLSNIDSSDDDDLPAFNEVISVYNSAVATFYAPSDLSGIGGMHRERIRALSSWRKEGPRYDCIFVNTDPTQNGMRGLEVARVRAFFSFKF